jgi:response regulator of citrate/malate metabolism
LLSAGSVLVNTFSIISFQEDRMKKSNCVALKTQRPLRVFVLEDDLELSTIIECVLRSLDSKISLDWATSAEVAIHELKEVISSRVSIPYDLIIADVFLDGKSTGIDFWRTCQELFPEVPVLMTSSLSFDRFFSTVGRESISPPYLQKPFTAYECKHMLKSMLAYAGQERAL